LNRKNRGVTSETFTTKIEAEVLVIEVLST